VRDRGKKRKIDRQKIVGMKNEGWKQKDIAEFFQTSPQYISRILSGEGGSDGEFMRNQIQERYDRLTRNAGSMTHIEYIIEFMEIRGFGFNVDWEDLKRDLKYIFHLEGKNDEDLPAPSPGEGWTKLEKIEALIERERKRYGV